MRKHVPAVIVVALATFVLAGLSWESASADAKRFRAFVYPDRGQPEMSVVVEDFRVNETVWDYGGVQYVWLHGPAGAFKMALSDVSHIEVVRFVELTQVDWARYEVKVTGNDPSVVRVGTMDIRVLRGIADGVAWYYYPATMKDRGMSLWRIVVGPDRIPPTLPAELPKPQEQRVEITAQAPQPPMDSEAALFARMSLEELNARKPLADVFFDFDMENIRPDGEATLERNLAWLQRWTSAVIRIDGYADPRGTQEYNMDLGQRRAEAARDFLVARGISASRISDVSRGESQAFCSENTEECWARNRRAHFVITAK